MPYNRDVQILEFWVCVHVRRVASASTKLNCQASATTSAPSATVIMFKIYWNPGTAFNNVVCAKKLQMQMESCSIIVTRK